MTAIILIARDERCCVSPEKQMQFGNASLIVLPAAFDCAEVWGLQCRKVIRTLTYSNALPAVVLLILCLWAAKSSLFFQCACNQSVWISPKEGLNRSRPYLPKLRFFVNISRKWNKRMKYVGTPVTPGTRSSWTIPCEKEAAWKTLKIL